MPAEPARPPHILCAGNLVLDEVFRVQEIPANDTKIETREYVTVGGGCAANAAVAIVHLGGKANYAGLVGDDDTGERILANLAREGVDCTACMRVPGARSQVSMILVNARGERTIVTYRDRQLSGAVDDLPRLFAGVDGVLIDNRVPGLVTPIAQEARSRPIPLVMDGDKATTPDDPLLQLATHLICSGEFLRATMATRDLAQGLAELHRRTGHFVAVTDGPNDVLWMDGGQFHAQRAFKVAAVDTLAAGDVFHGAFALALVEGRPLPEALRFAAAAAAVKCTRFGGGATAPTRAEVDAFLKDRA